MALVLDLLAEGLAGDLLAELVSLVILSHLLAHFCLVKEAHHLRVPLLDLRILVLDHGLVVLTELTVLRRQLDRLLVGYACLIKLILVRIGLSFAVESFGVGRVHLDGKVRSLDRLLKLLLFGVAESQVRVENSEGFSSMLHPLFAELLKLQLRYA